MKKMILTALALLCHAQAHAAGTTCKDLNPQSPTYPESIGLMKTRTQVGARWTAGHDLAVRGLCEKDQSLLSQAFSMRVTSSDMAAINRVIEESALAAATANRNDAAADSAIDLAFVNWSNTEWAFDKYLKGTALSTDEKSSKDVIVVGGTFQFKRMGGPAQTAPFAAALRKSADKIEVLDVCYNDQARQDMSCRSTSTPFARGMLGEMLKGNPL